MIGKLLLRKSFLGPCSTYSIANCFHSTVVNPAYVKITYI
ncbi:Uncharacterised protein [Brucella anthropi]|nr:Uncharacterised protein [Brucella anthropi]